MNTPDLEELERRLDDHPNCHSLGVAPEKLRALIAKAREADELRAEVERRDAAIGVMADALDVANNLICTAFGTDEPRQWGQAIRKVQKARVALGEAK